MKTLEMTSAAARANEVAQRERWNLKVTLTGWGKTDAVLLMECPMCFSRPGESCLKVGGAKTATHAKRVHALFTRYGAEAWVRVPAKGPVLVELPNKSKIDLWYDAATRLWTLQLKDSEGNQVGPGCEGTASYAHNRVDAVDELEELVSEGLS